jgi:hypothetical protein
MTPAETRDGPTTAFLERVLERVNAAGVFAGARIVSKPAAGGAGAGGSAPMLVCPAAASAAPAEYRLFREPAVGGAGDAWWVSLVTADRWLSESIESDLLHTGDKMEELVDEELAELGSDDRVARVEHFRSDDKLYTFRLRVPAAKPGGTGGARTLEDQAATHLLALEAAFRNLGDMSAGPDEE